MLVEPNFSQMRTSAPAGAEPTRATATVANDSRTAASSLRRRLCMVLLRAGGSAEGSAPGTDHRRMVVDAQKDIGALHFLPDTVYLDLNACRWERSHSPPTPTGASHARAPPTAAHRRRGDPPAGDRRRRTPRDRPAGRSRRA